MIKIYQRATIERAQAELASRGRFPIDAEAFGAALWQWGQANTLDEVQQAGYERLIDWCIIQGFRTRRRPIITLRTCRLVDEVCEVLGLRPFERQTIQGWVGIKGDLRDVGGLELIELLVQLERRGLNVQAFNTLRREVTPAQVRLVHAAYRQMEWTEQHFLQVLQEFGGVITPADLDHRGFDLVMFNFETLGFKRDGLLTAKPAYGDRPGYASGQQIRLIRTLWAEWSGADDEKALNAWLERFHQVSTLRFLTAPGASKVITALKAMKRRAAEAQKESA